MADFVLLTPTAAPTAGEPTLFVNLDRVLTIRPRDGHGAHLALLAHDGVARELDVRESPHDIVALARLDTPFAASGWRDELDGDLTDFHLDDAGVLKAALVDGETGGLATFALDRATRTWAFLGIEEPVEDDVVKAANDTARTGKRDDGPARSFSARTDTGSDAERLADGARRALNVLSSRHAAGTSNGKLACAWAVNEIAKQALGRPIGGGLSTIRMHEALRTTADIVRDTPRPGDIVISPTQGRIVGHVGIVLEPDGRIASNSSSRALFVQNYTMASWRDAFVARKRLGMHLFRIRDIHD